MILHRTNAPRSMGCDGALLIATMLACYNWFMFNIIAPAFSELVGRTKKCRMMNDARCYPRARAPAARRWSWRPAEWREERLEGKEDSRGLARDPLRRGPKLIASACTAHDVQDVVLHDVRRNIIDERYHDWSRRRLYPVYNLLDVIIINYRGR